MRKPAHITHIAQLTELAEAGVAIAQDLTLRALEAKDPKQMVELALAMSRTSDGVVQAIALRAEIIRRARRVARAGRAGWPQGEGEAPADPRKIN